MTRANTMYGFLFLFRARGGDQTKFGSESSSDEEVMSKRRKICDESKEVVLESENQNANDSHQISNITETEGIDMNKGDSQLGRPIPETQSMNNSRTRRSVERPVLETQDMDSSRGDSRHIPETQSRDSSQTMKPILETQEMVTRNAEGRGPIPETQGMDTSRDVGKSFLVGETEEMEPSCALSGLDESKSVVSGLTQLRSSDGDSSRNVTGRDTISLSDKRRKAKSISSFSDNKTSNVNDAKAVLNKDSETSDAILCLTIKKEKNSPKSKDRNQGNWLGTDDSIQDSYSESESSLTFDKKNGNNVREKRQQPDIIPANVGVALTVKREVNEEFEVVPEGFLSARLPRQVF